MTFEEIFTEYFSLYRGQASKIPVFGEREYTLGIIMGNSAIKKWERADGILWKELFTTYTASAAIVDGTVTYAAPTNMRKPPAFVTINGVDIKVIPVQDLDLYSDTQTGIAWFTGSAQGGYSLNIRSLLSTHAAGGDITYTYFKKATLLPTTTTPAAIVPEMSDPTFMIQDMLATRAQQARNGFVFKAAKAESTAALANMKIENDSGTYHNGQNMRDHGGWGVPQFSKFDIRL